MSPRDEGPAGKTTDSDLMNNNDNCKTRPKISSVLSNPRPRDDNRLLAAGWVAGTRKKIGITSTNCIEQQQCKANKNNRQKKLNTGHTSHLYNTFDPYAVAATEERILLQDDNSSNKRKKASLPLSTIRSPFSPPPPPFPTSHSSCSPQIPPRSRSSAVVKDSIGGTMIHTKERHEEDEAHHVILSTVRGRLGSHGSGGGGSQGSVGGGGVDGDDDRGSGSNMNVNVDVDVASPRFHVISPEASPTTTAVSPMLLSRKHIQSSFDNYKDYYHHHKRSHSSPSPLMVDDASKEAYQRRAASGATEIEVEDGEDEDLARCTAPAGDDNNDECFLHEVSPSPSPSPPLSPERRSPSGSLGLFDGEERTSPKRMGCGAGGSMSWASSSSFVSSSSSSSSSTSQYSPPSSPLSGVVVVQDDDDDDDVGSDGHYFFESSSSRQHSSSSSSTYSSTSSPGRQSLSDSSNGNRERRRRTSAPPASPSSTSSMHSSSSANMVAKDGTGTPTSMSKNNNRKDRRRFSFSAPPVSLNGGLTTGTGSGQTPPQTQQQHRRPIRSRLRRSFSARIMPSSVSSSSLSLSSSPSSALPSLKTSATKGIGTSGASSSSAVASTGSGTCDDDADLNELLQLLQDARLSYGRTHTTNNAGDTGAGTGGSEQQQRERIGILQNKIGNVYFTRGEYEHAKVCYEAALSCYQVNLLDSPHPRTTSDHNDQNPNVSVTLLNLGTVLWKTNELNLSLQRTKEALRLRQQSLGDNHIDTAFAYYSLAMIQCIRGEHTQAESSLKTCYDIRTQILGFNHVEIGRTLSLWGTVRLSGFEDITKAMEMHRKALAIKKMKLGNFHPSVVASMLDIARIHKLKGEVQDALLLYKEVSLIQKKFLCLTYGSSARRRRSFANEGKDYIDVGMTLQLLGNVYRDMMKRNGDKKDKDKNREEAKKAYEEAREMYGEGGLFQDENVRTGHAPLMRSLMSAMEEV